MKSYVYSETPCGGIRLPGVGVDALYVLVDKFLPVLY